MIIDKIRTKTDKNDVNPVKAKNENWILICPSHNHHGNNEVCTKLSISCATIITCAHDHWQILKENNWVTLENSWSYKGNWVVFKRKWFFPTMKNLSSSAPHQIQIDRLVINSAHMTKETNDGSFFIFHIWKLIKGRSWSFPIVFNYGTREFWNFEGIVKIASVHYSHTGAKIHTK